MLTGWTKNPTYLADGHLVAVGVEGAEQAEQAEGLPADGAALLRPQEVEQRLEEVGVARVRLVDATFMDKNTVIIG